MNTTGMKGLHNICKAKAGGLGMPDEAVVGEDIKIVLSINPKTRKCDVRDLLALLDKQKLGGNVPFDAITDAKIFCYKDLK